LTLDPAEVAGVVWDWHRFGVMRVGPLANRGRPVQHQIDVDQVDAQVVGVAPTDVFVSPSRPTGSRHVAAASGVETSERAPGTPFALRSGGRTNNDGRAMHQPLCPPSLPPLPETRPEQRNVIAVVHHDH